MPERKITGKEFKQFKGTGHKLGGDLHSKEALNSNMIDRITNHLCDEKNGIHGMALHAKLGEHINKRVLYEQGRISQKEYANALDSLKEHDGFKNVYGSLKDVFTTYMLQDGKMTASYMNRNKPVANLEVMESFIDHLGAAMKKMGYDV